MPQPESSHLRPGSWAAPGDVNAFFGLMLDNIANLLLTVGLLAVVFEFPTSFAIQHMIPGTAIGVLVGDLLFFWMALSMGRRKGRYDVTAMPLGLDTPSTFGMVFFVLGPAFLYAKQTLPSVDEAARYAWHIGICSIFISGLFKFVCACGSNWVRRRMPRAGLLGSLAAIALVLISFLPLLEILQQPVVGLVALAIILTTLETVEAYVDQQALAPQAAAQVAGNLAVAAQVRAQDVTADAAGQAVLRRTERVRMRGRDRRARQAWHRPAGTADDGPVDAPLAGGRRPECA